MPEPTLQEQLDQHQAAADAVRAQINAQPAATEINPPQGGLPAKAAPSDVYYHLYLCPWLACLQSANPVAGSWHQRGLHLATDQARKDVPCPGCHQPMVIGRDGLKDVIITDKQTNTKTTIQVPVREDGLNITTDKDGNAVAIGRPVIYPAPGQPDQTAQIDAEAAEAAR